jgi:hypothetical protein
MYHFSRAIFRELRPHLVTDDAEAVVLRESEAMVERLAHRRAPRRPARELFRSVRGHVALEAQLHARCVIEHYLAYAQRVCELRWREGLDAFGSPLPCRATTRHGRPCVRRPVDENGYCPSHRHLARSEEPALVA